MKNKSANNIVWVEYWILKVDPTQEAEIFADQTPDGNWKCEIELPLINQTVCSIAKTQVDAMIKTADQAAKIINDYMSAHQELNIKNIYTNGHYEIVEDEKGNFLSIEVNSEHRRKESKKMVNAISKTLDIIGNAVEKIEKISYLNKNIFIQVVDKSVFPDNLDDTEISDMIDDNIRQVYGYGYQGFAATIRNNLIINVGYIIDPKEID